MAAPDRWMCIPYILLLVTVARASKQCDRCNCFISDSVGHEGVTNVRPPCFEGSITWLNALGGLRIQLQPQSHKEFRTCFSFHSKNSVLKVSRERQLSDSFQDHRVRTQVTPKDLLDTVVVASNRTKDFCMTSSSAPIVLFLETAPMVNSSGIRKVLFHYVIHTKATPSALTFNPMDECQACTDEDFLKAYCTSDFVATGRMSEVNHHDHMEKTAMHMDITRVVRQRQSMFQYSRLRRSVQGVVYVPRKCDVSFDPDVHLILTGRLYLGHVTVTCARFLEDWRLILRKALAEGTLECSLD